MTCWERLGLSAQADEDEIRRAYARLLKEHRPDRDPTGFLELRAAYEQARLALRMRTAMAAVSTTAAAPVDDPAAALAGSGDPPAAAKPERPAPPALATDGPFATAAAPEAEHNPPAPPPPAAEPTAPPAADDYAEAVLQVAATMVHRLAEDRAVTAETLGQALRALAAARKAVPDASGWRAWHDALRTCVANVPVATAAVVDDAALLEVVQAGDGEVALAVLSQLHAQGAWTRLSGFATRLAELPDRSGWGLSLWLAPRIAIVDFERARALVDGATGPRVDALGEHALEIDRALMLGRDAAALEPAGRIYVAELLIAPHRVRPNHELRQRIAQTLRRQPQCYLVQLLDSRHPGYFDGKLLMTRPGQAFDMLSLVVVSVLILVVASLLTPILDNLTSGHGAAGALLTVLTLACTGFLLQRPLGRFWRNRCWPWLDAHLGPFDSACVQTLGWAQLLAGGVIVAAGISSPWQRLGIVVGAVVLALALSHHGRNWIRYAPTGWRRHLPPWPLMRGRFAERSNDDAIWLLNRILLGILTALALVIPALDAYPTHPFLVWAPAGGLALLAIRGWAAYLHGWSTWKAAQAWSAGLRLIAVITTVSGLAGGCMAGFAWRPGSSAGEHPAIAALVLAPWLLDLGIAVVAAALSRLLSGGKPSPAIDDGTGADPFALATDPTGNHPNWLVRTFDAIPTGVRRLVSALILTGFVMVSFASGVYPIGLILMVFLIITISRIVGGDNRPRWYGQQGRRGRWRPSRDHRPAKPRPPPAHRRR